MRELLKMHNITKIYPNGIVANKKVNFSVNEGEIHALVGENGAGKTTLMKILFGLERPEEGSIYINGSKVNITSPIVAIKNGIGMVHQHFMLVPSLTVAENIILGIEPQKNGFIDFRKAIEITEKLSEKYNLKVDPKAMVRDLPVGMKQKVEILKALLRGAKILILDEPTAVLTPQETTELFNELFHLKNNGHTIIFISHKLREVKQISDRITIMRHGKNVGVFNTSDVTEQDISRLMVGRDVILKIEKTKSKPGNVVLYVKDLNHINEWGKTVLKNVSFSVRSGEILGIAGVEGNGQRELVEIITGLRKLDKGELILNGKVINDFSIRERRELGISHVPEDRMVYGVAADGSIAENLISDRFEKKEFNRRILMDMKKVTNLSNQLIKEFRIQSNSPKQKVRMLSGGNIQKVVVAREFSSEPKLLIANQPTRGIDVGATELIHRRIIELRDKGVAVLLVSADLNEVMELSDSLIVMFGGEIVAYFEDVSYVTEEELGAYMLGLKKQSLEEIRRVLYA
ncbi:MAG: ral nucleoside transport system ATP-binding protein [Thermoanaerobacterium sp.]|jgi:simple sugar transport system ATP-binding protein|nr:mglA [Defluviitaleaceae bacterium]MDI3477759.1 ral nucleoside transport system ATP-binding protein [Thermoanaerobacterium sp.]MDN5316925.1 ral nucleoside transport system ATP-binding protein [Thermoanaerobacterium sp.]